MPKTLILCSDGTGNAFGDRATNVSKLIRSIDLRCAPQDGLQQQIAFYDQGVGTDPKLVADAKSYSQSRDVAMRLKVLDPPKIPGEMPGWWARFRGLVDGYGLDLNIRQFVEELARHYEDGDAIHLYGFSRGAFTVRAVAGFLHCCGLPHDGRSFDDWFAEGFALFTDWNTPSDTMAAFRERAIDIDFLGIWDTVKAYGGIRPIGWPWLRHNPSVKVVRHALALNEQRAWFQHTTWGSLLEKMDGKPIEPDPRYVTQNVEEVWFRGFHSDVGGGREEEQSASVSLLWMLGEASNFGLRLNDEGKARFKCACDFTRAIDLHNSWRWWWPVVGLIPRQELHNDHRPPKRPYVIGGRRRRDPTLPELRDPRSRRVVLVHASALDVVQLSCLHVVHTRLPPESRPG